MPFTALQYGPARVRAGVHALLVVGCLATAAAAQAAGPASTALATSTAKALYPGTLTLEVDATDTERRILQVRERIPVRPGSFTLQMPRWIPGYHAPSGEVARIAGLRLRAAGRDLAWQRDPLDTHAFRTEVPAGATVLEVEFQSLTPLNPDKGRVEMTRDMLSLAWNSALLYPAGYRADGITVEASLKLPRGWQSATSLRPRPTAAEDGRSHYRAVSLERLVDAPVFAGLHMKHVTLDDTAAPVELHLMADTPDLLDASEAQLQAHRGLVQQADRLFGARHYGRYAFLLSQSKHLGGQGLEHHESSENGVEPGYFKDWDKAVVSRTLLPHEYVHSWNGKYRRPAELTTAHFNEPMRDGLLWVYEGQTQYWGQVLTSRSGLATPAQMRELWAGIAATAEREVGRRWRDLQDTTNQPIVKEHSRSYDWPSWQRGADYYDEGALLWLEADMLIRERSGGVRSLDDFARRFFARQPGDRPGDFGARPYDFDEVVRTLAAVEPLDWAGFLRRHLAGREAPLAGLALAGWKLVYTDEPGAELKAEEVREKHQDLSHSIGLQVEPNGKLKRVVWDSPAWRAGLSPAATLVAINERAYSPERLAAAVAATKEADALLELLVVEDERYRSVRLEWRGGLRYPKLERIDGTPDRLSLQMAPR